LKSEICLSRGCQSATRGRRDAWHALARLKSKQLIEENANFRSNFINSAVLRINLVSHDQLHGPSRSRCDPNFVDYNLFSRMHAIISDAKQHIGPVTKSVHGELGRQEIDRHASKDLPLFTPDPLSLFLSLSLSLSLSFISVLSHRPVRHQIHRAIRTFAVACSGHPVIIRSVGRPRGSCFSPANSHENASCRCVTSASRKLIAAWRVIYTAVTMDRNQART